MPELRLPTDESDMLEEVLDLSVGFGWWLGFFGPEPHDLQFLASSALGRSVADTVLDHGRRIIFAAKVVGHGFGRRFEDRAIGRR
jgi:hypothetical protein